MTEHQPDQAGDRKFLTWVEVVGTVLTGLASMVAVIAFLKESPTVYFVTTSGLLIAMILLVSVVGWRATRLLLQLHQEIGRLATSVTDIEKLNLEVQPLFSHTTIEITSPDGNGALLRKTTVLQVLAKDIRHIVERMSAPSASYRDRPTMTLERCPDGVTPTSATDETVKWREIFRDMPIHRDRESNEDWTANVGGDLDVGAIYRKTVVFSVAAGAYAGRSEWHQHDCWREHRSVVEIVFPEGYANSLPVRWVAGEAAPPVVRLRHSYRPTEVRVPDIRRDAAKRVVRLCLTIDAPSFGDKALITWTNDTAEELVPETPGGR